MCRVNQRRTLLSLSTLEAEPWLLNLTSYSLPASPVDTLVPQFWETLHTLLWKDGGETDFLLPWWDARALRVWAHSSSQGLLAEVG